MSRKLASRLILWLPWIMLVLESFFELDNGVLTGSANMVKPTSVIQQALKEYKPSMPKRSSIHSLTNGSDTYRCDEGFKLVEDVLRFSKKSYPRTIPPILHQTSITRCLTPAFHTLSMKWRYSFSEEWSYLFHDEAAMERLLNKEWKDFPLLGQVLQCVTKGTMKADLWRYLVLYEYGGVYADIDSAPSSGFNATLLLDQQSWFVVDQYSMMSEFFIASAPKHPLLFYTIHHALQRIVAEKDTGTMYPGRTTGPHALLAGFRTFQKEVGKNVGAASSKPISAGIYNGRHDWNVTILGDSTKPDEYVLRLGVTESQKLADYKTMGLKYYLNDLLATNKSCLKMIFEQRVLRKDATVETLQ